MKISLIEDEPDCFESFQDLLAARGHEVTVYQDADDAVDAITKIAASDVILLDLMMRLGTRIKPTEAYETGIALYHRIRKISASVRIIVITARLKTDVWETFKADSHVDYLGKPVNDVAEFYRIVEEQNP